MILEKTSRHTLQILHQQEEEKTFSFIMEVTTKQAPCPRCGFKSTRKHSRYTRKLQDVPMDDKEVAVLLCSNKWFCEEADCPTSIFTERFSWLDSYRRKTNRLEEKLTSLAFSMSCLQAEKVCTTLKTPISHDALLALIYRKKVVENTSPFRGHR